MDFKLPDGDSIRLVAPFADMFNHSSEVKQCHTYDVLSGNLCVLAGRSYVPGDQVYSSFHTLRYYLVRLHRIASPGFYQLRTCSK